MKKIIILGKIIIIFSICNIVANPTGIEHYDQIAVQNRAPNIIHHEKDAIPLEQQEKSIWEKAQTPIMILMIGCIYCLIAPHDRVNSLLSQLTIKHLAINCMHEYSHYAWATLCHEFGHAFINNMLYSQPIEIFFGSSSLTDQPFLTLGPVKIIGTSPLEGRTNIKISNLTKADYKAAIAIFIKHYIQKNNITINNDLYNKIRFSDDFTEFKKSLISNKFHYALTLLAGGMAGILGNNIQKIITQKKSAIDHIDVHHLMNMLFPLTYNSDGYTVLRDCFDLPGKVVHSLSEIACLVELLCECLFLIKLDKTIIQDLHCLILLSIINYLSKGYVRFNP